MMHLILWIVTSYSQQGLRGQDVVGQHLSLSQEDDETWPYRMRARSSADSTKDGNGALWQALVRELTVKDKRETHFG